MRRKLIYLAAVLIVVAVGSLVAVKLHSPSSAGVSDSGTFPAYLSLSAPAFAQGVASTQFPYTDAGIACYAKFEKTIDLQKVQRSLRVVEAINADSVIGVVELAGSREALWPHVYVTRDGWVLVYFSKSDPSSRIVLWSAYSNGAMATTTLRDAMLSVGRTAGLDLSRLDQNLQYFHFQYPEATSLMIVVDSATSASDPFYYTIPASLSIFEGSYSVSGTGSEGSHRFSIDADTLENFGGNTETIGTLGAKQLSTDQRHTMTVVGANRWNAELCTTAAAVCFLYR